MQNPEPQKLKSKFVKETRLSLLEAQSFKCAICGFDCSEEQAVLDHDHKAGHVRAVLHRGCNAAEGKVMNTLRRCGIKDPTAFLVGLMAYHVTHAENQTGLIHPAHKTLDEKKLLAKKRAKKRKAIAKTLQETP